MYYFYNWKKAIERKSSYRAICIWTYLCLADIYIAHQSRSLCALLTGTGYFSGMVRLGILISFYCLIFFFRMTIFKWKHMIFSFAKLSLPRTLHFSNLRLQSSPFLERMTWSANSRQNQNSSEQNSFTFHHQIWRPVRIKLILLLLIAISSLNWALDQILP